MTGTGSQRAYACEYVACSLICLLSRETVPVRIRVLFSIVVSRSTITQNQLESHDLTIPLRSNGNKALKSGLHIVVTIAKCVCNCTSKKIYNY